MNNSYEKLNSGRCLVLVGSGPSCEVGCPSWHHLAKRSYQKLTDLNISIDSESYKKYLESKKYPEFFRLLERDLGNCRQSLVDFIKPLLEPIEKNKGSIYEIITRWPFACYLTTNYDDEISLSLNSLDEHFTVIGNRPEYFSVWRDGVSHIIQKLHSDLNSPKDVVITSLDYKRLQINDSGQYFRDRLSSIFTMFDIVIIGHSLADPDIQTILQLAKKNASPDHPIYFISSGFAKAEEMELFEQYNIELLQYSVVDGHHTQLLHLLRLADRFVVPRSDRGIQAAIAAPPADEVETAIAIFLYRKLQGAQPVDYLAPLILSALSATSSEEVAAEHITSLPLLQKLTQKWTKYDDAIKDSITYLENQGLVCSANSVVTITDTGKSTVDASHTLRSTEREQAYGQFKIALKAFDKHIGDADLEQCARLAESVIVSNFTRRGSVIANTIFSERSSHPNELSDIFALVSNSATKINDPSVRSAFVGAMHQFIVQPTPPQREYLASVSQGFFLYHALGLDPKCGEVRKDIFRKTLWLCDSSVMLPLVAIGCHNHDYAINLFDTLAAQEALVCTTPKLLQEVWEHFCWAVHFVENNSSDSLEYLRAALVEGSYRQNLFLDGYIRLSAEGDIGTFNDYINLIASSRKIDRATFEENIINRGIRVISISNLPGFVEEDWADIEVAQTDIQKVRQERGTYRAPLQVESESEILVILKNLQSEKYTIDGLENLEHFYFISQSQIIDHVSNQEAIITWSPEAVYRYLSALSDKILNPALLQQCMLQEYFYAGISFIDRVRYEHFFGPSINAAKTSYQKERKNYIEDIEDASFRDMEDEFERTPDLKKPFFAAQMGWYHARETKRKEDLAMRRALTAEERVKVLELEKEHAWKIREKRTQEQEEATIRNSKNPKHVQKRRRQAKKRRRKGT